MKRIELYNLENIQGGSWLSSFTDGVCAGWASAQLINIVAYSNPITGSIATGLNVGCAVWGIYRIYQ